MFSFNADTVNKSDRPSVGNSTPIIICDDFLPADVAKAMREDIEAHFARPYAHGVSTHQIWNYWFVPELYTYLRTSPEKVIQYDLMEVFQRRLHNWSLDVLGMGRETSPYLSLYISGCRQSWHNDSDNGRFAYVYSLTKEDRRTIGGETLVLREGDLFRSNLAKPNAGRGLYEAIAPRFNRLVVFDDRLPHAVERVEGSMDPIEGRFVLHGHLKEGEPTVTGGLSAEGVLEPVAGVLCGWAAEEARYHGPLTLRLTIDAAGSVKDCTVMADRVMHRDKNDVEWATLRARIISAIGALKFPPSVAETVLVQPISFGAPLSQSW